MPSPAEDRRPFAGPLAAAAAFAGRAPSIHNTQPWLWRADGDLVDLRLQPERLLPESDPDRRLAILSCGAALHHARLLLAAHGCDVTVRRLPDPDDPDLLARLRLGDRTTADPQAARLVEAAAARHTDRRSEPGEPPGSDQLQAIATAVREQGADMVLLQPGQVADLAAAVDRARGVESDDPAWQVEVAGWVGRDRDGAGIPAAALPADDRQLTAPVQVLRQVQAATVAETYRHTCAFGVLRGNADGPGAWLSAGEAMSAGWLTATGLGVAVLPLSIVVEVAGSRDMVSRLLGWSGYPYLVLRFATEATEATEAFRLAATPRLGADKIIERF